MALPTGDVVPIPTDNLLQFVVGADGAVEVREGSSELGRRHANRDLAAVWRESVAENPRLIAVVRSHPDAPYGSMIAVLDQLQLAKAKRISLQLWER